MTAEENKRIARTFYEVFNQGDLGALSDFVDRDFVDHNPVPGQSPGLEGLKQALVSFRAGFPDMSVSLEDAVAEGDRVATRARARGTHRGDFIGIPATGRRVDFGDITMWRIANGRLAEAWYVQDVAGLMMQLGVMPGAAQGDGRPAEVPLGSSGSGGRVDAAESKEVVSRFIQAIKEIWHTGNTDLLNDCVAPDVVLHITGLPPGVQGLEAFKEGIRLFRNAFPDMKDTVEDLIAERDKVAFRVTWQATHQGELRGIPPTGKRVKIMDMHIDRIADGKIAERWGVIDSFGMMQQLGLVPTPG